MIERGQVKHDSQNIYYRSTIGAAEAGSTLELGITLKTKEDIRQVLLRVWREGQGEKLYPLVTSDDMDAEEKFYKGRSQLPETGCLIWYYFIIATVTGTKFYGNNPEQLGGVGELYDQAPPSYQITVYDAGAKTPDWAKHAVMYQIFPDRFCRVGDKLTPKRGAVFHASWQDDPCYYKDPDTKEIVAYDFFGGNLRGIESKLPYLRDLGINTIYLNPVFESESNHHYDTGDYLKIDPILGTNDDFKHLVETAKHMGIRIILDGVFSHTGSNSRYFNRMGQYDTVGAYQSKSSPYYEWYNFRNFPNDYESWWNFDTLPDVKETTPSYMDFIIRNKDSVLHHWLGEGISGWRLDVIDELPAAFSQAFYKELKATDPDALMIGEVWEDASHKVAYGQQREYLCGHEMDSAMNYPLRQHLFDFLMGYIDGGLAMRRMESLRENYPKENFYVMMNLIGSHDIVRAITFLGEAPYYDGMPAIQQSRYRMDEDHYNLGLARLLMAALFQMTYPGAPCVYYGDEIAMQGFKDPYNRRPYRWDDGDTYVQERYRKYIRERNEHTALQTGELLPLYGDGDLLAFARVIRGGRDVFGEKADDDAYIVAFNRHRSEEQALTVQVGDFAGGTFVDAFHPEKRYDVVRGEVTVHIPPLKGVLLREEHAPQKYAREAGVLLHPTSLPSKYGIGDLGKEAYKFVDFLAAAGQHVWQILPLGPVDFGYSPYQSPSAFAGNPMLIDLDDLVDRGWLQAADVKVLFPGGSSFVDFTRVWTFKHKALKKAYERFRKAGGEQLPEYLVFCDREKAWLDDFALFMAAKNDFKHKEWTKWPDDIKHRKPKALAQLADRLEEHVGFQKFLQFLFDAQWTRLHDYAKEKGIRILGDMPIFIAGDSADVWSHQELFDLNPDGNSKTVAGVPPDYFSATGQLWGNPQYDWDAMKEEHYAWWIARFRKLYKLVDVVRIDHFRGFESYWEIDGKAKTAINGRWLPGPGKPFFDAVKAALGSLPVVAEDLGIITDEVEKLRDDCGFPGMKVLHFTLYFNDRGRIGFVAPENSVIYTGTHDNNTTVGWYTSDINDATRAGVAQLIGADRENPQDVAAKLIRFAYASRARLAIVPMQDLLGLDSRARMNTPGTVGLNWKWCLKPDYHVMLDPKKIRAMVEEYGRS